ncbi:hypothetical protein J6590_000766 [Homalodisca vitripennis]|nr:hypothetical protein J6590_000766 [Homalodisca vitripennis]
MAVAKSSSSLIISAASNQLVVKGTRIDIFTSPRSVTELHNIQTQLTFPPRCGSSTALVPHATKPSHPLVEGKP